METGSREALSDVHCKLQAPADLAEHLLGQCAIDGKGFYVLTVEVLDSDGERVATARLNYRVKRTME